MVWEVKGRIEKENEGMRGHTGKGVLLGSEGGDEGILLFLGRAGGRAGCGTGLAAGGDVTTAGGDTICGRDFPTKARYCSMVSSGGVETGKS